MNGNNNDGSSSKDNNDNSVRVSDDRISLSKFRLNAPDVFDDNESFSSHVDGHNSGSVGLRASIDGPPRSSFQVIGDDLENLARPVAFSTSATGQVVPRNADGTAATAAAPQSLSTSTHENSCQRPQRSIVPLPVSAPSSSFDANANANADADADADADTANVRSPLPAHRRSSPYRSNSILLPANPSEQEQQQIQQQQQQQHESYKAAARARQRARERHCVFIALAVSCTAILIIAIAAAVVIATGDGQKHDRSANTPAPTPLRAVSITLPPTSVAVNATRLVTTPYVQSDRLQSIYERGVLRCGIQIAFGFAQYDNTTQRYSGIDVDLCHAAAAAIFGDVVDTSQHVEFRTLDSSNRFQALRDDELDVLFAKTTHTMQRHVNEPSSGISLSFSAPYIYERLHLAGLPEYVECAEILVARSRSDDTNSGGVNATLPSDCSSSINICVLEGGTHETIVRDLIQTADNETFGSIGMSLGLVQEQLYSRFMDGDCNLVAGEYYDIAETVLRRRGYDDRYEITKSTLSQEPLCMVTKSDDVVFSDFIHWVLQALFTAEDRGITQTTAILMGKTEIYGDNLQNMFVHAVQAVGNYGEVFARNLESIAPRAAVNTLNRGDTGLIFPFPFGDVTAAADEPPSQDLLRIIQSRGFLRCGITDRPFFASFNAATSTWSGFDVDFCRAIAAALFSGNTDAVEFIDLNTTSRFTALQNREVDVLSRLTTHTFERDVHDPTSGMGLAFSQPIFYDGLTFGGIPAFVTCADNQDITSVSCRSLQVCVLRSTTFETLLIELLGADYVVSQDSIQNAVNSLRDGNCNVIAGGAVDVFEPSMREDGYSGPYRTGTKRFSRDPLALVTREDDHLWSRFVFWIAASTFHAERYGITMADATRMPTVDVFGPSFRSMFQDAVGAVGSYAEIFERHGSDVLPRGGQNALNEHLSSPQILPLPGIM